ncbi:MAG TPA: hypothetical protein DD635_09595 [Flavobacteriales bacterium]|nr:hypothetical protein [Flavobacteriales bacterium]
MPVQQRIKFVVNAIQWILFIEHDPLQSSINRCKTLIYDFVRRSRDSQTASMRANFRNLAKAQMVKMQQLEKKRDSLLIHALGGLAAGGFLIGWAILAVIL